MKKLLLSIISVFLLFSLCGCSSLQRLCFRNSSRRIALKALDMLREKIYTEQIGFFVQIRRNHEQKER